MSDKQHWTYDEQGNFVNIPTTKELCHILETKFNEKDKQILFLQSEIDKLKDEKWKDKEIQRMKDEIVNLKDSYYYGFPISKEEHEKINEWVKNHEAKKHKSNKHFPRGGAIGGSYTYCFIPTSIGTFSSIKCTCGESFTFQEEK